MPSSGKSSRSRDQTHVFYVSCTDEQVDSLALAPPGKPMCESSTYQKIRVSSLKLSLRQSQRVQILL